MFAFGITPKRTLHNFFANHKDGKTVSVIDLHPTQVSKAAFNCQCENLISESPFVAVTEPSGMLLYRIFFTYRHSFVQQQYASRLFCVGLRGPPVC